MKNPFLDASHLSSASSNEDESESGKTQNERNSVAAFNLLFQKSNAMNVWADSNVAGDSNPNQNQRQNEMFLEESQMLSSDEESIIEGLQTFVKQKEQKNLIVVEQEISIPRIPSVEDQVSKDANQEIEKDLDCFLTGKPIFDVSSALEINTNIPLPEINKQASDGRSKSSSSSNNINQEIIIQSNPVIVVQSMNQLQTELQDKLQEVVGGAVLQLEKEIENGNNGGMQTSEKQLIENKNSVMKESDIINKSEYNITKAITKTIEAELKVNKANDLLFQEGEFASKLKGDLSVLSMKHRSELSVMEENIKRLKEDTNDIITQAEQMHLVRVESIQKQHMMQIQSLKEEQARNEEQIRLEFVQKEKEYEAKMKQFEMRIVQMQSAMSSEKDINGLRAQIRDVENQRELRVLELNGKIRLLELQVTELQGVCEEKNALLNAKNEIIEEKNGLISINESLLVEKEQENIISEKRIRDLEDENGSLLMRIRLLVEQVEKRQEELKKIQQSSEESQIQLKRKNVLVVDELSKKTLEQAGVIEQKIEEVRVLNLNAVQMEERIRGDTNRILELETKLGQCEDTIRSREEQIGQMHEKVKKFKEKGQAEIDRALIENRVKTNELESIKEQLKVITEKAVSEISKKDAEIESLNGQNLHLLKQLTDSSFGTNTRSLLDLLKIDELNVLIKSLQQKFGEEQQKNSSAQLQIISLEKQLEIIRSEIIDLNLELERKQNELSNIFSQDHEKNAALGERSKEIDELNLLVRSKAKEIEEKKSEIIEKEEQLINYKEQLHISQQTIKQLQDKEENFVSTLRDLSAKHAEASEEIVTLSGAISKLENIMKEQNINYSNLQMTLDSLEKEKKAIQDKLSYSENNINSLTEQLSKRISSEEQLKEALKDSEENFKRETLIFTSRVDEFILKDNDNQKRINGLREELDCLAKKYSEGQVSVGILAESNKELKSQLSISESSKAKFIDQYDSANAQLNQKLGVLESSNEIYVKKIASQKEKLNLTKIQFEEKIISLQKQITNLETQRDSLFKDIQGQKDIILSEEAKTRNFNSQLNETNKKLDEANAQIFQASLEKNNMEQIIENQKKNLQRLEEECSSLRTTLLARESIQSQTLTETMQLHENDIQTLKNMLQTSEEQKKLTEQQLKDSQQLIQNLENQLEEKQNEQQSRQEVLDGKNEEIQILNETVLISTEQIQGLQEEIEHLKEIGTILVEEKMKVEQLTLKIQNYEEKVKSNSEMIEILKEKLKTSEQQSNLLKQQLKNRQYQDDDQQRETRKSVSILQTQAEVSKHSINQQKQKWEESEAEYQKKIKELNLQISTFIQEKQGSIDARQSFQKERESVVIDKEKSLRDIQQLYIQSRRNEEVLEKRISDLERVMLAMDSETENYKGQLNKANQQIEQLNYARKYEISLFKNQDKEQPKIQGIVNRVALNTQQTRDGQDSSSFVDINLSNIQHSSYTSRDVDDDKIILSDLAKEIMSLIGVQSTQSSDLIVPPSLLVNLTLEEENQILLALQKIKSVIQQKLTQDLQNLSIKNNEKTRSSIRKHLIIIIKEITLLNQTHGFDRWKKVKGGQADRINQQMKAIDEFIQQFAGLLMMLENKVITSSNEYQNSGPNMLAYSDASHSRQQFRDAKDACSNIISVEDKMKIEFEQPSFQESKESSQIAILLKQVIQEFIRQKKGSEVLLQSIDLPLVMIGTESCEDSCQKYIKDYLNKIPESEKWKSILGLLFQRFAIASVQSKNVRKNLDSISPVILNQSASSYLIS